MEWKDHIKAVIKDAIANPPAGGEALDEFIDKKAMHILSFVPEPVAEEMGTGKTKSSK